MNVYFSSRKIYVRYFCMCMHVVCLCVRPFVSACMLTRIVGAQNLLSIKCRNIRVRSAHRFFMRCALQINSHITCHECGAMKFIQINCCIACLSLALGVCESILYNIHGFSCGFSWDRFKQQRSSVREREKDTHTHEHIAVPFL